MNGTFNDPYPLPTLVDSISLWSRPIIDSSDFLIPRSYVYWLSYRYWSGRIHFLIPVQCFHL